MDNFKAIYRILSWLEAAMDAERPDYGEFCAEHFQITEARFTHLLKMLLEAGYISGVVMVPLMGGGLGYKLMEPCITLKGLEYLEENTTMQKVYRALKGIKDVIPGA